MKRMIGIILAAAILMCGCAFAEKCMRVEGRGTVYLDADTAEFTLGVVLSGKDLAGMQQEVNGTIEAICKAMIEAGLSEDNISTSSIYVYPQYDYNQTPELMIGYRMENSLSVRTQDIDKLGAYIDAACAAGANTFNSITFTAVNDAEARKQALELAVQDAAEKAKIVAAAAGEEIAGISEIDETVDDIYYGTDSANGLMRSMTAEAASTTVRAAQINVTARVQINYQLK